MDAIVIFILLLIIQSVVVKRVAHKYNVLSERYLWVLFLVHVLLTATYIFYAFKTTSDAFGYFARSERATS
ncbi:MAG: hypothetical protein ABIP68_04065, partial [Ferruginibacter sp.]